MCRPTAYITASRASQASTVNRPKSNALDFRRKKAVRFARAESVVIGRTLNREDLTPSEKARYWWSRQEKSTTTKKAKLHVYRFKQEERCQWAATIFGETVSAAADQALRMEGQEEADFMESPGERLPLVSTWACTHLTTECGGLERYMLKSSDIEARRSERTMWRRNVVRMYCNGVAQEDIAEVYRTASMEARVFARILGFADEIGVFEAGTATNKGKASKKADASFAAIRVEL